jgi:hypothetical protein
MNEIIESWNKKNYPLIMECEHRSYYKDGHDNDLYVIRVFRNKEIINIQSGDSFLDAYNKIKGEPN